MVGIRVTAAPGREQLDVAHGQKRALESALATKLAAQILGPAATVQFRELGRDRAGLIERGEADIAMVSLGEAPSPNVTLSPPYAAGGVVVAVRAGSSATDVTSLAGKRIGATTMGEVNANELAAAFLASKGVASTVTPFPGLAAAVSALDSGQVDAVMGDRTGIAVVQSGRAEKLKVIGEVASRPYVIAVRKDASALQAALSAVLRALLSSGEVAKMATAAGFPFEAP